LTVRGADRTLVRIRLTRPLVTVALVACVAVLGDPGRDAGGARGAKSKPRLVLTSPAFADGATLPVEFTCSGAGGSPPLAWKGVPKRTKQLALVVDDPDAPNGTFTHWVVAGITRSTRAIGAGEEPSGSFGGNTSIGRPGYFPPCPPAGPAHRYVFTLYALRKKVDLAPGADAAALDEAMRGRILARAELVGRFGR
jgi:Raf kinase inhibitor-like YbhB/YbcL family protein